MLFITFTPNNNSNKGNNIKITNIILNIIKADINSNCIVTVSESTFQRPTLSLNYTALSRLASIFFEKPETSFNACRQASVAFSHISWVLYLSRQYFNTGFLNATFTHTHLILLC